MPKMKPKNLTFKVEKKQTKNSGDAFELLDSEGYSCGFFETEQKAKQVQKRIWLNLVHASVKPLPEQFKKKSKFKSH